MPLSLAEVSLSSMIDLSDKFSSSKWEIHCLKDYSHKCNLDSSSSQIYSDQCFSACKYD